LDHHVIHSVNILFCNIETIINKRENKSPGDIMKWGVEEKTNLLLGLFVASIIAANLMGTKITHFFIDFSVGIFIYPLTFLITDIVQEIHGKQRAKQFVWIAFVCVVVVAAVTAFAVYLPFAERSLVKDNYTQVFGMSIRIFIASIIAFLVSNMHDVWAYNFWRKVTKGKHMWLRNNFSSIAGEFVDTTLFMFIAFYAISPKFTVGYIFALIIPYWLLKVFVTIVHTPFCYLGVRWLRGKKAAKK
jgi:queuosine precursor transporter